MGLFDFISGSSQDPSQQGLPPQHSSVARLLELAGGLTGLTPLAAAGYLADQGTVAKFNEAYWPKFKNQMVQAGVPQQKVDMLDGLPIEQRTAVANQLYQAALTNVPKEPKYTAAMGPNGQEEFIDPLSGRVLSTLPKGTYTQSFKPKSEAEKFGSPTSLFEQDYLSKHPGDYAGAASYAANAYEQIRSKYTKSPRVDVNVNTPTPPGNFLPNPADNGKTSIAIEHDKAGNLSTRVVNVPFSTVSGVTHPPKPEAPYTVSQFFKDKSAAMAQAKTELTRPGLISKGLPSGPQIAARANDILASKGINPFTGKQLQNGEKVKLSNGTIATWTDK